MIDEQDETRSQDGQEQAPDAGQANALVRVSRWPGWIWAVPVAALFFVFWLGVKQWVLAAPTVSVTFGDAGGVSTGTAVRHQGVKVGEVEAVRMAPGLEDVELELSIEGRLAEHLREGARFWIVRPRLGGGLTALLAGAHVAMLPGEGAKKEQFEGLAEPPVLEPDAPGRRYVLHGRDVSGLSRDSSVMFDGMEIGRVMGIRYREDVRRADIHIFVRAQYSRLVRESTVFWKTGGLSIARGSQGVSVEVPRLSTLAGGAVAFSTPQPAIAAVAEPDTAFALHANRGVAMAQITGPRLAYSVTLPAAVGNLERGAAVELEGVAVGRVNHVELEVDADKGELRMPVTLALEPERFGIDVTAESTRAELRERLDRRLGALVGHGLRARAAGAGIVAGGSKIELVWAGEADTARLLAEQDPPGIPATGRAPGIDQAVASLGTLAGRLEDLPIEAIAGNLRRASARIAEVTDSARIDSSLDSLDTALANLERISASAERHTDPLLSSLRETATAAESVADMLTELTGDKTRRKRDLTELVTELTETARAIRRLASYLERHPEALIRGRDGGR